MDDGRVFTIKGAKEGVAPVVGIPKSIFKSGDTLFRDGRPFTKETLKAQREMERGMLPPQLRVPVVRTPVINDAFFDDAMAKDGGKIVKTETGGKAVRPKKKTRIQVRGFGKARR